MLGWTHDDVAGASYFRIGDGVVARQIEHSHALIVDLDDRGGLVGFEVLDHLAPDEIASFAEIHGIDDADISFVNEALRIAWQDFDRTGHHPVTA